MRHKDPQLSVIVPTRNEHENILPLLTALREALVGIPTEVIFVDDSDDDTPECVTSAACQSTEAFKIQLAHREQGPARAGGLATAVSSGLALARAKYVAVIDADLQHPPERLRTLFDEAVETNADVVLATRYRAGGKSNGLAGMGRHLFSLGLKWLAKIVFPEQLLRVSDPLGGFFLVRRSIFEGVTLRPIGYKISLELLIRCRWARLVEVPYQFNPRIAGQSKADFKQGLMVLRHMGRLVREVPAAARFWKFCLVGATGVIVNFAIFFLGLQLHLSHWSAWLIATEGSLLSNFILNHLLTWRDVSMADRNDLIVSGMKYHAAVAPSILLNLTVFGTLSLLHGEALLIDEAIGVIAGMLLSYWLARRVVFAERSTPFPPKPSAVLFDEAAMGTDMVADIAVDPTPLKIPAEITGRSA